MSGDDSIDFGLVTALPEELAALRRNLPPSETIRRTEDTRTYYRSRMPFKDGDYEIVALQLPRMGNIESALATADMIRQWNPRYVIMIGIAGGMNRDSQALGDIAIGDQVIYYEPGKISTTKTIRPFTLPADPLLLDRATSLVSAPWSHGAPNDRLQPYRQETLPKVHIGPIASGEKVIAHRPTAAWIKKIHPKTVAIEMESAGVAAASFVSVRRIGMLAIRSLCDFADEKKNDDWHSYAADAAARFVSNLLLSKPVPTQTQKTQKGVRHTQATSSKRRIDSPNRTELFELVNKNYDLDAFQTLCFHLEIDFDELPGPRKSSKVRELIIQLERKGQLQLLVESLSNKDLVDQP